jgi:hypothetical protein
MIVIHLEERRAHGRHEEAPRIRPVIGARS